MSTALAKSLKNATATQVMDAIAKNTPDQRMRVNRDMKIGQYARQGDVYITKIKSKPKAWNVEVTEHNQVALGTNNGSRHCADGAKVSWPTSKEEALAQCPVKLFAKRGGEKLTDTELQTILGPVVEADKDWVLSHPEHAHHTFEAGTYLVTYQFDERTRERVRD